MKKNIVYLCVTFFIGIFIGSFLNLSHIKKNDKNILLNNSTEDLSTTDNHQLQIENKTPLSQNNKNHNKQSLNIDDNQTNSEVNQQIFTNKKLEKSPSEDELDAYNILLETPPPHLSEPNFFGMDPNSEEVLQAREEALNEFVTSMEEAGLPERDVEAAIEPFRQDIKDRRAITESSHLDDVEQQPLTPEEQIDDFRLSLLQDTDEPFEDIEQMVEDMTRDKEAIQAENEMSDPDHSDQNPE
ncbi:hypothetical protein [Desulfogranum marinum]|uniref:hypothetical protein n=1 Tax=Desulfogranum marinum TaxID=453220 RepID=UPI0019665171|nr:hypothetical protein [Desulfogranum marinum]MBM9513026.1 hypothetical protein [Desulfogranum marinum]